MQVDHINENTIRVRIDKNELARRGLKVLDLLGDKDKIQHFFYSILDEIDTDHTFSQDAPVTFQVMPNNGGLDLLISKVTNKERDNLAQLFDNDSSQQNSDQVHDPRRSFFDLDDEDDTSTDSTENSTAAGQSKKHVWKTPISQAYSFNDLDKVTELAESLQVSDLSSDLYFVQGKFYLDLSFINEEYAELKPTEAWAIANEYGIKVRPSEMARVRTNGKNLLKRDALEQLRRYFNHR